MTMRIFKKIKDNISLLFNRDYKWNNHSIKIMMINQFELYSLFQQAQTWKYAAWQKSHIQSQTVKWSLVTFAPGNTTTRALIILP